MESPAKMIRVEAETVNSLAVIYHGGSLGETLRELLLKDRLRVVGLFGPTAALPVWERPDYVFFFVSEKEPLPALKEQFTEARQAVARTKGKMVLVLDNSEDRERDFVGSEPGGGNVFVVKIRGRAGTEADWLRETARRVIKLAFSLTSEGENRNETLIVGRGSGLTQGKVNFLGKRGSRSVDEVLAGLSQHKRRPIDRKGLVNLVLWGLILVLLVPFAWLGVATVGGFSLVTRAAEALKRNETQKAQEEAARSQGYFFEAKRALAVVSVVWPVFGGKDFTERYFNILGLGERAADLVGRAGVLLPRTQDLTRGILTGSRAGDLATWVSGISLELEPMSQDLGLIEGQLGQVMTARVVDILSFVGMPGARMRNYREEISGIRGKINQASEVLSVLGEIVPTAEGQSRTYLVVFQNSAELRPTGGFIGSYALVHVDGGRMSGFKIYDVYSADGQLRGSIAPPDEILHYLGQPQWFMRDANWAADWPLTARRLEWFLEKETGVAVDGVVGLDLAAVQKMLMATGPVVLPGSQESVTTDNFFEKAEFAAEINFFPGSDQKPQFLAQVAAGIFSKLTVEKDLDWLALGQAVQEAVFQKDILFYFNSVAAQKVAADNNWTGAITTLGCGQKEANCLMLVEANFGANKANFFVKRSVRIDSVVDKGGGLETTVIVKYRNESPNASWPGGIYKNYLRFLVPLGSKMESFDLGDKRAATVSSILTAEVLKGVSSDQFLVFQNIEQALVEKTTVKSAHSSYGALVEVPVQGERTVKFRYRPPYKLDFGKTQQDFRFVFLKQPGAGADLLDFALDYPSFLTPVWMEKPMDRGLSVLALPQKLIYNTELSKDRVIEINFRRQ